MRNSPPTIFTTAPALCLALVFTLGIAIRLGPPVIWAGGVLLGICAFLALSALCGKRWCLALEFALLAGFLRMHVAELPLGSDYRNRLLHERCSARIQLVIRETPLLEGSLAELDSGRGLVTADIVTIQTIADETPKPAKGTLVLTTTDWEQRQRLRVLKPGDNLQATGILTSVRKNEPLEATYCQHLRSRRVFHQFELMDFESLDSGVPRGMRQWPLKLRQCRIWLAKRLVRNFHSPQNAQLTLALGLGMSEFIPQETRRRQAVSGTIHVFAISGMHIGMVTLMLSTLLRWCGLPPNWQRVLLGILAAGYVLLTGSSISSLRALWMVWLALYATQRHRRTAWLNALGCAAGLALLANPWQLLDLGFQYSHLTVMVLLLGAPIVKTHVALLAERNAWLPRELRPRRRTRLLQWLVGGLDASIIAWLGNLGLAMHLNPQLSWGAPLLNLPLGILIALALAFCPLRLFLGVILPRFDYWWAQTLEWTMRLTEAVAESGHQSAFAHTHPLLPVWAVACYYCVFFATLIYLQRFATGPASEARLPNRDPHLSGEL
ncbi:MAG: ComEC/Rec2 family competence protein [Victivallales bacterium]|nr:ComEC/Rec2 family competence protein [Victivallales bacterium]